MKKRTRMPLVVIDASIPPDARAKKIMDYFDNLSPKMRRFCDERGVNPSAIFAYLRFGISEDAFIRQLDANLKAHGV
jgi:hypothetical protein